MARFRRGVLALTIASALAACGSSTTPSQAPAPPAASSANGFVLWSQIPAASISAPAGLHYAVTQIGGSTVAEIGGVPEDAVSSNRTGGVSIRLPAEFERQASGMRVRITVRAAGVGTGASLGVAYSTNEVGNSGWRQFPLSAQQSDYSFTYNVPIMHSGNGDFLGFRNYGPARLQVSGFKTEIMGPSPLPNSTANSAPAQAQDPIPHQNTP